MNITYDTVNISRANLSYNKEQIEKFNEIKEVVNSKSDRVPRVVYLNNESSYSPDPNNFDIISNLDLNNSFTLNAPKVNEKDYEDCTLLMLRLRSSGIQSLTFNAIYRVISENLPTATVADKLIYMGFMYNKKDKVWDVVSINTQT